MKVSINAGSTPLAEVGSFASWAEVAGFDAVGSAEVAHDPFLPLALAASATTRVELHTGIAVAFARTPMALAYVTNDLHVLSGGRHVLGLGSQTKPHITRRFGMEWGQPAAQMREYVTALRAILADWNGGQPLSHEGEYYRHTLMTDTFRPQRHDHGNPPIHLAAVGTVMTKLAGEICDGLIPHGFSTEKYFREVTVPALEHGLDRAGRDRSEVVVHTPGFVQVHDDSDPAHSEQHRRALRRQVAFYGSTPAYRGVLDLHGWGDLHEKLHALSVTPDADRWERMGDLVSDEVLDTFCISGSLQQVVAVLLDRFGGLVDQVHLQPPASLTAAEIREALAPLQSHGRVAG